MPAPAAPPVRAYAQSGGYAGGGYASAYRGGGFSSSYQESERAGGWSYSEDNGRGRYRQWGDAPAWHGPCPPSPDHGCTAGQNYSRNYGQGYAGQAGYRGGPPPAYRNTGRDAYGYLTWPGKTPPDQVGGY